jgi:hypothetical protein
LTLDAHGTMAAEDALAWRPGTNGIRLGAPRDVAAHATQWFPNAAAQSVGKYVAGTSVGDDLP